MDWCDSDVQVLPADEPELGRDTLVAEFLAAWGRPEEATVRAYLRGLADVPDEPLRAALERLMRASSRRPSIARVRRVVAREALQVHFPPADLAYLRRKAFPEIGAHVGDVDNSRHRVAWQSLYRAAVKERLGELAAPFHTWSREQLTRPLLPEPARQRPRDRAQSPSKVSVLEAKRALHLAKLAIARAPSLGSLED